MKIKVSEAEEDVLDGLVATCEGYAELWELGWELGFTSNWSRGGPIIERERIGVITSPDEANIWIGSVFEPEWKFNRTGPTPLIAAMRCYVASKLGEEVEVPEELL
jgi:hypothetical protein